MIKSIIKKRTYRAIYRLLDRVSPVPFDCGTICGADCCTAALYDDRLEKRTTTAWRHLLRDPLIYDLVWKESRDRDQYGG